MHWGDWPPYVPVAERRARAQRAMQRLRKQGHHIEPVTVEGRGITRTFWGNAWCDHLHRFASLANRLERGRTYVRNGSVCHLSIDTGTVRAKVMGNELYDVELEVAPLSKKRWRQIQKRCAGHVGSLIDLLQGRLSDAVMGVVTDRDEGLFPSPREFDPSCSCPDYTDVCKHVAAVFYGVGVRLDLSPELLFELRGVDHLALIDDDTDAVAALTSGGSAARIADDDLGDVFGIELADEPPGSAPREASRKPGATPRGKRKSQGTTATKRPPIPTRHSIARPEAAAARKRAPTPGGGRGAALPSPLRPSHVRALRERLQVSRAELGKLLGMTEAIVGTWERRAGPLTPRRASLDALERVWSMSRAAARRELG